jgi:hypothetical protein
VREADDIVTFMCRLCGTSESLKLLEPYGPVQACTRIALPVVAVVAAAAAVGAVVVVMMFNTVTTECIKEMARSRPERITDLPSMPNREQNFSLL